MRQHLLNKSGNQQMSRRSLIKTARAQEEQSVFVQLANRRTMRASDVISVDFQFGLGIHFRPVRQHHGAGLHLRINMLRVLAHNHLALKYAARRVVEHIIGGCVAARIGRLMVNFIGEIGMVFIATQHRAVQFRMRALGHERQ